MALLLGSGVRLFDHLANADALLFGRVTYEMMEAAWRPVAQTGVRPGWMPEWMEPFARIIDARKKYVVSSTLNRVDWIAGLSAYVDLKLVSRLELDSGAVALRYEPIRHQPEWTDCR